MPNPQIKATLLADDRLSKTLNNVGKNAESMGSKIRSVANKTALALGGIGIALTAIAKKSTDFATSYLKDARAVSRVTGLNVTQSSRLVAVTNKLGYSTDQVTASFAIFSRNISRAGSESQKNILLYQKLQLKIADTKKEIADTTKEIAKNGDKSGELHRDLQNLNNDLAILENQSKGVGTAFDKLNIKVTDQSGVTKDFNKLLLEVADAFKAMPDGVEKTALSMELFGRSGKDMIKFLNLGSDGIASMEAAADKLGLTLTPKTIGKIDAYIKSQKKLKENTDAVKLSIAELTTPALTKFNDILASTVEKFNQSDSPLKQFAANVLAFGGPISGAIAAVAGFGANIAQMGVKASLTLGAVGIAIAAIAVAAYLIYKNWGPISNFFVKLWQGIQNAFFTAWSFIINGIDYIKSHFFQLIGEMIGIAATLPIKLPLLFGLAIAKVINILIHVNWGAVFAGIWKAHELAWQKVKDIVVRAWHFIHDLKWSDIMAGIAKGIGNAIIGLIEGAIKGALKGLPGNLESKVHIPRFKAGGGLVNATQPYIVGERGPELFTPQTSGKITPNGKLGNISNSNVTFNVNVGMYAGTQIEKRKIAAELFAAYEQLKSAKGMA